MPLFRKLNGLTQTELKPHAGNGRDQKNSGTTLRLLELSDGDSASGGYLYSAAVPATRSARDYTTRMRQHYGGVAVPQETVRILWQPR